MALARLRARAQSLTDLLYLLGAPLVLGLALINDAGGAGGTGDPDADKGDQGDDKGDGDKGDPKLGAAGEKALREERAARTRAEKDLKGIRKELEDLKTANASDAEKAVLKAKEEGKAEALKGANARVLRSEIKAAAAGRLADPADAVRLLDTDDFVDDEGEVDDKKLAKAIDQLLKDKPYLAGKARANGDGGGGPRGKDEGPSMDDWLRSAARHGRR